MDRISIDLDRRIGAIDRNVFGGFVEHLGRCVYGGIFEPGSPRSGPDGLRTDVLEAARRLRYSNIRYPGGNFVSAYRWRDGVGPVEERPGRYDPAWHAVEPNTFGTNEFIGFCRQLGAEPYLVVNCRRRRHARGARLGGVLQRHDADGAGAAARRARLPGAASRPLLGHRQRGRRPMAGRLQDARGVRAGLPRVRQGHALGGSRASSSSPRPCRYWEGDPRRAHPAAAGAGCRPHRLPLASTGTSATGRATCRPTWRSPS